MIDEELRKAVEILERDGYWGENENVKAFDLLISFVEQYLDLKGWPEEKKIGVDRAVTYEVYGINLFNEALRLCKLVALKHKNKVSGEKIENLIMSKEKK